MKLHRSGEDYLKTILILRNENGIVRSTDVASHLKISKVTLEKVKSLCTQRGVEMLAAQPITA